MSNATPASSPDDELYDLREQVLAAQRLFEEENWIWAYKALAYAGRLARRLPDAINPFVEAGRPFASMPEREPPPAPEITDADIALHAMVTKTYAEINEEREANGWKPGRLRSHSENDRPALRRRRRVARRRSRKSPPRSRERQRVGDGANAPDRAESDQSLRLRARRRPSRTPAAPNAGAQSHGNSTMARRADSQKSRHALFRVPCPSCPAVVFFLSSHRQSRHLPHN